MSFLSRLCGAPRSSIKRRVAQRLGGAVVKSREGHTVVVSDFGGWNAIFDIDSPNDGPPMMFLGPGHATRIAMPFQARDEFWIEVRRRRMIGDAIFRERSNWPRDALMTWNDRFEELRPQLTPPETEWGYGDFDYEFAIRTNDEQRTRDLFADPDIRASVQRQRLVDLRVERVSFWLTSIAWARTGDLGVVIFQDTKIVDDIDRIEALHLAADEIRARLVSVGAASMIAPNLFANTLD